MKIAVIKTGGKQYKASVGQNLKIEKINAEVGAVLKFQTMLVAEEENVQLGKPLLDEIVEGKILEHGKGKKISVVKFKNKTRYKRNVGHRQPYTKVEITKI
jgi:large subunit ribosomal protein L21